MAPAATAAAALRHPVRALLLSFVTWKLLLLLVAVCSPGHGYDTSTSLLFAGNATGVEINGGGNGVGDAVEEYTHIVDNTINTNHANLLTSKLTRWDAIYFVQAAYRGHRFEQEWAFGWGFSKLVATITALTTAHPAGLHSHDPTLQSLVAISIAHAAHLLAVLVLYRLSQALFPRAPAAFPLTAALLHVLSPAGLFLSAPYAESACALLSFTGSLLFTQSRVPAGQTSLGRDLLVLAAGVAIGAATSFRNNALLNGLLLLEEAFHTLYSLAHDLRFAHIRRLLLTGLAGLCAGAGFIFPQYLAYTEYCTSSPTRPWCSRTLPSIYTFVQEHYWNVGPFRYWTLPNLPLFLLAAPMLVLLVVSAAWALTASHQPSTANEKSSTTNKLEPDNSMVVRNLAISQLILTLLTLTTAHVQIINRISSACPVWVWYLASPASKGSSLAKNAVRAMVMYAIIQGALFALFLPPA